MRKIKNAKEVKDKVKKISLNRYIMRIPYFFMILLFLILVFIMGASALFFKKHETNHGNQLLDAFLKSNREIFLNGDYSLLEKKIDQLIEHPPAVKVKIFNAYGDIILDRQNKSGVQRSGLFKLPAIVIEKTIEPRKSINLSNNPILWGTIQLTMTADEESTSLQTFFLALLGVFTLCAVFFFLFIREKNKGMDKELNLLKDFIEDRVAIENLQTRMFKVEELAMIQKKIKSDSKSLRSLKEELEKKKNLALIGNFASSIVHDIRNPLIVINGYVDMLRLKFPDIDPKFTEKINDSTLMIERLLEDILKFVREQKLELKMANHAPENVIQAAVVFLEPAIQRKSIAIAREIQDELILYCDIDRLSRAIINILKNSIEISRPGDTITLKTYREKNAIVFSIKDMGPGVPESIRNTIFEPFATANKIKGTGLGLFIAKNIVEAHNGSIIFETSRTGTEFLIKIPA
ncbi:MAG TPA: HAMP domain-containing sensor histidine kinase [Candidatus Deferrimicrobium sp.]|nr:HAMP domain-containing sensor histidine kinase [Candidatus Deferrimicrobium sp.]